MGRVVLVAVSFFLCTTLFFTSIVRAQTTPPTSLVVLHTAPQDAGDHLALSVFFTLRGRDGAPILKKDVRLDSQGTIQLTGSASEPIDATVGEPTTPIKIALVIDASGSMVKRIDQVREAAKEAVKAAPPQAEIAIYSFNTTFQPQTPGFLSRASQLETIQAAIDGFKTLPAGTGDTCLYDAADGALDSLIGSVQNTLERRALILFTDGKDREAGGTKCTTNFVKEQIITKAQQAKTATIPIYTIGLCNANCATELNQADLNALADQTTGIATFGQLEEMKAQFVYIMEVLNSQWVATANVYPRTGDNQFSVTVKANENTPLTGSGQFVSGTDYTGKPTFTIEPKYVAQQDKYAVTLNVVNAAAVSEVKVEIWEGETKGALVKLAKTIVKPVANQTFDVSTSELKPGQEYWYRVTAQDRNGNPFTNKNGDAVLYTYNFPFNPELGYEIDAVQPDWEHNTLTIRVNVHGRDSNALIFKGKIEDKETRELIADIPSTPLQGDALTLPIPTKWRQATGARAYLLTLTLDDNGRPLTQTFEPTITAPDAPGWFARIGNALGSPIALGLLGVVLIGAIGTLVFMRRRSQVIAIPRPFNSQTMRLDDATVVPTAPITTKGQVRIRVVKTLDRTQVVEQTLKVPCTIGRSKSDLMIAGDNGLSRPHAQVTIQDGAVFITDMESTNGTFINETRLKPFTPTKLDPQVQVRLGPHTWLTCTILSS